MDKQCCFKKKKTIQRQSFQRRGMPSMLLYGAKQSCNQANRYMCMIVMYVVVSLCENVTAFATDVEQFLGTELAEVVVGGQRRLTMPVSALRC